VGNVETEKGGYAIRWFEFHTFLINEGIYGVIEVACLWSMCESVEMVL